MTKINCALHGVNATSMYCNHIGVAIDSGRYEKANVIIDGWFIPHTFCDVCLKKAEEVIQQNRQSTSADVQASRIEFDDDTSDIGCLQCLADWFISTNQGTLATAVRNARVDAGLPPEKNLK